MADGHSDAAMHQPQSPTKEQWEDLCRDVKASLLEEVGTESWYLLIVSLDYLWPLHRGFYYVAIMAFALAAVRAYKKSAYCSTCC